MKIFTGKVISTKMLKTATVAVERVVLHPVYKKRIRRVEKYHVHDEKGVKEGQLVKFVGCRPVSRLKRWKIVSIVGKTPDGSLKKPTQLRKTQSQKGGQKNPDSRKMSRKGRQRKTK